MMYRLHKWVLKIALASFVLAVLVLTEVPLLGQTLAQRHIVAAALDTALAHHDSIIVLSEPIPFQNKFGVCDTLDTLPIVIAYDLGLSTFTITSRAREPYIGYVPEDGHPLVRDLNLYLNRIYAMEVNAIPGLPASRLFPACDTTASYQPYLVELDSLLPISAAERAILHAYVDSASYRSTIASNRYWIQGDSLFGSDIVKYFLDGENWHGPDSALHRFDAYVFHRLSDSLVQVIPPYLMLAHGLDTIWLVVYPVFRRDTGFCVGGTFSRYWLDNPPYMTMSVKMSGIPSQQCEFGFSGSLVFRNDSIATSYNNSKVFTESFGLFVVDTSGYLAFRRSSKSYCSGDTIRRIFPLFDSLTAPAEYCKETFCIGGHFKLDSTSGAIQYIAPSTTGCGSEFNPQPILCFQFCDPLPCPPRTLEGVIAASSVRLDDSWPYDSLEYDPAMDRSNVFEKGMRGRWRPMATYAYKSNIVQATGYADATERVYKNAGVFNPNMELFSWTCPEINDSAKWLMVDTITRYTPNGEPVEERDILHFYSTARFGYNGMLPTMIAKNAAYSAVDFQSFEEIGSRFAAHLDTRGHAGRRSYILPSKDDLSDVIVQIRVDSQIVNHGFLLKFWSKRTYRGADSSLATALGVESDLLGSFSSSSVRKVAQTGEWTLYEVSRDTLVDSLFGNLLDIRFKHVADMADTFWVDDVRIQPLESEGACYVYDPGTLRLVAGFDDQHFGAYYQYNGEGKLVRKIRETERGIRTVQETQYNMPRVGRDYAGSRTEGDPGAIAAAVRPRRGKRRTSNGDAADPQGTSATFNLLDAELGPDGPSVRFFGLDSSAMESLKRLALPRVQGIPLPDPEKLQLLDRMESLDSSIAHLANDVETVRSDEEEKGRVEAIATLQRERSELLQRAGINEEEWRSLARDLDDVRRAFRKEESAP